MLMLYRNYFTTKLKQLRIKDYMHTNINIATTCSPPPEHGQYKNGILYGSIYSVSLGYGPIYIRYIFIYMLRFKMYETS